ncbi:uncharacterized protein METZ01_LOCUS444846, partial [marine metagenome]
MDDGTVGKNFYDLLGPQEALLVGRTILKVSINYRIASQFHASVYQLLLNPIESHMRVRTCQKLLLSVI